MPTGSYENEYSAWDMVDTYQMYLDCSYGRRVSYAVYPNPTSSELRVEVENPPAGNTNGSNNAGLKASSSKPANVLPIAPFTAFLYN